MIMSERILFVDDEPGVLGHGDELTRENDARSLARRMPAKQRLESRHAAVPEVEQGLVVQLELPRLERATT